MTFSSLRHVYAQTHCFTGAGWGGCTVSLVAENEVDNFINKIKNAYGPYKGLEGEKLHEVIFATKPSSGACGESVLHYCGEIHAHRF